MNDAQQELPCTPLKTEISSNVDHSQQKAAAEPTIILAGRSFESQEILQ